MQLQEFQFIKKSIRVGFTSRITKQWTRASKGYLIQLIMYDALLKNLNEYKYECYVHVECKDAETRLISRLPIGTKFSYSENGEWNRKSLGFPVWKIISDAILDLEKLTTDELSDLIDVHLLSGNVNATQ